MSKVHLAFFGKMTSRDKQGHALNSGRIRNITVVYTFMQCNVKVFFSKCMSPSYSENIYLKIKLYTQPHIPEVMPIEEMTQFVKEAC